MARVLDEPESRKRWLEIRDLWNEFDPIGVRGFPDWPRDEYENYCDPSLRLLEQDAGSSELEAYVHAVVDYMGLEADDAAVSAFVQKLQTWFQNKWSDTVGT